MKFEQAEKPRPGKENISINGKKVGEIWPHNDGYMCQFTAITSHFCCFSGFGKTKEATMADAVLKAREESLAYSEAADILEKELEGM